MTHPTLNIFNALVATVVAAASADAQLVNGWGLETGQSAATLTEGTPGSFSTTAPSGNAGPRALLPSPVSLTNIGDIVQLSGTVSTSNAPGNQQLRWGLYNTNSHAVGTLAAGLWTGADPTGWLGYMVQLGGGNGNDRVAGRAGTGAGVWLSNTDAYEVGVGPGSQPSVAANTPYTFTLKLTRTGATKIKTDYTFVGGTVNRSGSFTDTGASTAAASYNAVGFLINTNTGAGAFSNISVSTPKELRLRVNTTTGGVSIVNSTNVPLTINYYEIRSTSGALNLAGWYGFDKREGNDAIGAGWDEAGGSSANVLSEANLFGNASFAPSTTFELGNAFTIGGAQDLIFSYAAPNQSKVTTSFVEYVAGGVPGDYNGNNVVDAADYVVWRKSVGAATIANRGPGITGNVGQADYEFWRSHFGAITAAGAGTEFANAAIPEPSTAALTSLCLAVAGACVRRRQAGV